MNPEQIEQLIRELLETGKILATEAYKLAVQQIYTYAIMDFVLGIPALILGIIFLVKSIKNYEERYDTTPQDLAVAGSVVLTGFGLAEILFGLRYVLNPQWYAVKLLVETFIK